MDRAEFYGAGRTLQRAISDEGGDGTFEGQLFYGPGTQLERLEKDTDDKADQTICCDVEGRIARLPQNLDADGKPHAWMEYNDGVLASNALIPAVTARQFNGMTIMQTAAWNVSNTT